MFGTPQLVNEGLLGLPPSTKRLRLDAAQASAQGLHTISTGAGGGSGPSSPAGGAVVPPTPPSLIVLGPAGFAPPAAQLPAGSPQGSASPCSPPAASSGGAGTPRSPAAATAASPRGKRDSRSSRLSPEEKVDRVLKRFPRSFCEELGVSFAVQGLGQVGGRPQAASIGGGGPGCRASRAGRLLGLPGATLDSLTRPCPSTHHQSYPPTDRYRLRICRRTVAVAVRLCALQRAHQVECRWAWGQCATLTDSR